MGFTIQRLADLRPFAFHSSGQENFEAILHHRKLRSASTILEGTGHDNLLTNRRATSMTLQVNGETVVIRDNRPLRPASVQYLDGWSLSDLLKELNSRVFLWPGTDKGPIRRGRSHFERYAAEGSVFTIRVPTLSLVAANHDSDLWVTRCNSGSARHHGGQPVPRGPSTFQLPKKSTFRPSQVIELSYIGEASLPVDAQWSESLVGPWKNLSAAD